MSTKKPAPKGASGKAVTPGLKHAVEAVIEIKNFMIEYGNIIDSLSGKDRQRLHSIGIKNHGFVDEAFEVAEQNPDFLPPHFDMTAMTSAMTELVDLRELTHETEQLQQAISEVMYPIGNKCYKNSLRIYASVKEAAKNKVEGAQPLYEALMNYFKKKKRVTGEQSVKEIEHDVKNLIEGKADGEVIIKNETPKTSAGTRTVVDNVKKGKATFVERDEESSKN